jgi:hypothetical protein
MTIGSKRDTEDSGRHFHIRRFPFLTHSLDDNGERVTLWSTLNRSHFEITYFDEAPHCVAAVRNLSLNGTHVDRVPLSNTEYTALKHGSIIHLTEHRGKLLKSVKHENISYCHNLEHSHFEIADPVPTIMRNSVQCHIFPTSTQKYRTPIRNAKLHMRHFFFFVLF